MADIRKRGPYQWQVRIRRKGHPSQTKTFNTKAEAEAWAQVTESEMVRGVFVSRKEAESTTLAEALDRYEQEVSVGKKGHSKEKDKIDHWRKGPLGSLFLTTIRSSDLSKWRDDRLKRSSPATVNRLLNLLSHVFTVAIQDWGMGGLVNPVPSVRRPKNPLPRERRLLPGELDQILAATGSPSIGDVIRFAIETGMRRGEISHTKWEHVDFKKKVLLVPETKTGEPRRIPLSTEAIRVLSDLPRRLDGMVWSYDEKGLGITRVFQEAVKRARTAYEKECADKKEKPDPAFLVDLHFHDLRREATSRFFELGLDATKVKEITGHKTYSMLARYTNLKAEDIAVEIDRLEKERDRKAVENQVEKMK